VIKTCLGRGKLTIEPVTEEDLPQVWSWYRDIKRYKYATGLNHSISFDELRKKYMEAYCNRWEFFFKISDKECGIMLGVIKGRVRYLLKDEAWISSLLIDETYQNTGVGRAVVCMLEEYLKDVWSVRWLYTGVTGSNDTGLLFWKNNNYQKVRKTRYQIVLDEKPEDIIIMVKNLGNAICEPTALCDG
jgi:ribosomal protein S18 acetylase RimI-like enzyme